MASLPSPMWTENTRRFGAFRRKIATVATCYVCQACQLQYLGIPFRHVPNQRSKPSHIPAYLSPVALVMFPRCTWMLMSLLALLTYDCPGTSSASTDGLTDSPSSNLVSPSRDCIDTSSTGTDEVVGADLTGTAIVTASGSATPSTTSTGGTAASIDTERVGDVARHCLWRGVALCVLYYTWYCCIALADLKWPY